MAAPPVLLTEELELELGRFENFENPFVTASVKEDLKTFLDIVLNEGQGVHLHISLSQNHTPKSYIFKVKIAPQKSF